MSTLHLGTHDVATLLELLPSDVTVFTDGDSWEVWGETQQTDECVTEGHAEHVVVRGRALPEYLADIGYIMSQDPSILVPMTFPAYQAGTIFCITNDNDWSEELYSMRDRKSWEDAQG